MSNKEYMRNYYLTHKKHQEDRRCKHNHSHARIYFCWQSMKDRCYNPNNKNYKNYGGRGIKVCDEWKDFVVFEKWAKDNDYNDKLTIDRIDVNGNYEPSNCRWVDMITQENNKTNNRFITYNNETHTLMEWSKILNCNYNSLRTRLERNWSIERAFNVPFERRKMYVI